MATRFGGVGTVVLAAAIATCGLFMLSGVGPAGSNDVALPAATPTSTDTEDTDPTAPPTSTDTTEPDTTEPETTEPDPGSSTTDPTTTSSTTTSSTTTSTTVAPPSQVPLSVGASNTVVGAGGTVTFDGTCAAGDDGPRGPVTVWVIGDAADDIDVVDTGISSASWTFVWTAPTDEASFDSFTFQFWCGNPDGAGYPADLQRRVDMVASAAPPVTPPLTESEPTAPIIPETD